MESDYKIEYLTDRKYYALWYQNSLVEVRSIEKQTAYSLITEYLEPGWRSVKDTSAINEVYYLYPKENNV